MTSASAPDRASTRVELAVKCGGLVIALSQAALPLLDRSNEVSPALLALAGGMMALSKAIRTDREREARDSS
jgi:hypothetical protein